MRKIERTDNVNPGMVILTGTHYYLVTDVFPSKFRGKVWSESLKDWGSIRDVPLPSPTHLAYEVDNPQELFPMPQEGTTE
jgi:hypothetical protein